MLFGVYALTWVVAFYFILHDDDAHALRPEGLRASASPPRSRDSIPATMSAGAMAGLPPAMTSAAQ
jgi:hypothetical protein